MEFRASAARPGPGRELLKAQAAQLRGQAELEELRSWKPRRSHNVVAPMAGASDEELNRHVGQRLRERRRQLSLSQDELAKACGKSLQRIRAYEDGAGELSAMELWDLAKALRIDVDYFFDEFRAGPGPSGPVG